MWSLKNDYPNNFFKIFFFEGHAHPTKTLENLLQIFLYNEQTPYIMYLSIMDHNGILKTTTFEAPIASWIERSMILGKFDA